MNLNKSVLIWFLANSLAILSISNIVNYSITLQEVIFGSRIFLVLFFIQVGLLLLFLISFKEKSSFKLLGVFAAYSVFSGVNYATVVGGINFDSALTASILLFISNLIATLGAYGRIRNKNALRFVGIISFVILLLLVPLKAAVYLSMNFIFLFVFLARAGNYEIPPIKTLKKALQ